MTEIKMCGLPSPDESGGDGGEIIARQKRKRPSVATVKKPFIRGRVTQKTMSFRVDLDNLERMKDVKNKSRLINELLRNYFEDTEDLPL